MPCAPGHFQSRCRCGGNEPSPGVDVVGVSPVPAQVRRGWAQSKCRCGRTEPSPGADVVGVGRVPVMGPRAANGGPTLPSDCGEPPTGERHIGAADDGLRFAAVGARETGGGRHAPQSADLDGRRDCAREHACVRACACDIRRIDEGAREGRDGGPSVRACACACSRASTHKFVHASVCVRARACEHVCVRARAFWCASALR